MDQISNGCLISWYKSPSSEAPRETFREIINNVFGKGYLPPRPRPVTLLGKAIDLWNPQVKRTPTLKEKGWAITCTVKERADVTMTTSAVLEPQINSVRGEPYGIIWLKNDNIDAATATPIILDHWTKLYDIIDSDGIALTLTNRAKELGAVALTPTGGIYWAPNSAIPAWDDLRKSLDPTWGVRPYILTIQPDMDTLQSMAMAVDATIQTQLNALPDPALAIDAKSFKTTSEQRLKGINSLLEKTKLFQMNFGIALTAAAAAKENLETIKLISELQEQGARELEGETV